MRTILAFVGGLWASSVAQGQMKVDLVAEAASVLVGEPVGLECLVTNDTAFPWWGCVGPSRLQWEKWDAKGGNWQTSPSASSGNAFEESERRVEAKREGLFRMRAINGNCVEEPGRWRLRMAIAGHGGLVLSPWVEVTSAEHEGNRRLRREAAGKLTSAWTLATTLDLPLVWPSGNRPGGMVGSGPWRTSESEESQLLSLREAGASPAIVIHAEMLAASFRRLRVASMPPCRERTAAATELRQKCESLLAENGNERSGGRLGGTAGQLRELHVAVLGLEWPELAKSRQEALDRDYPERRQWMKPR